MKKRKKQIIRLFLIIIHLLFCSYYISAYSGISPAKTVLNFVPNTEQNFQVKLFGYNEIIADASCTNIIKVDKIIPKDDYHIAYITATFPESMPTPGEILCGVRFLEKTTVSNEAMIGTETSVGEVIVINVPYPGKYATINLIAQNVKKGEPLIFNVHVNNLGEETLNAIKVNIKIEDLESGKVIDYISTNTITLPKFSKEILFAKWDTIDFEPARYKAIATLDYGGEKSAIDEKEFLIGTIFLEFIKSTKNGTPNQINPIVLTVESWWGDKIKNVFAEITMQNASGVGAGSFTTVSTDFNPWERKQLQGYWDATQWGIGNYTADIKIKYENKETQATWLYELSSPPKEISNAFLFWDAAKNILINPIFLIIVIAVIVIFDVMWVIRNKKRKRKK